jgi:uncharacterized Zn finger protein
MFYGNYPRYVPVAERRRNAAKKLAQLGKKRGFTASPVVVEGRTIASTVWGRAWCEHLEGYSDYDSRLPRGRTYVRNGSVVHLELLPGKLKALVSGSELYTVEVTVKPLPPARWKALVESCAGQVASVVELLSGRLSERVMEVLCHREKGLFPSPKEISLRCSCPDWAEMCKHVAAVLYGVGARLDRAPELLFTLRQVEAGELVSRAAHGLTAGGPAPEAALKEEGEGLAALFGIELETGAQPQGAPAAPPAPSAGRAQSPAGAPGAAGSRRKPPLLSLNGQPPLLSLNGQPPLLSLNGQPPLGLGEWT